MTPSIIAKFLNYTLDLENTRGILLATKQKTRSVWLSGLCDYCLSGLALRSTLTETLMTPCLINIRPHESTRRIKCDRSLVLYGKYRFHHGLFGYLSRAKLLTDSHHTGFF